MIRVGESFYIGSSTRIDRRKRDHLWRLRSGKHPIPALQDAWDKHGTADVISIEFVSQRDMDKTAWRDALRASEQRLLNEHFGQAGCCNRSKNARGPDKDIAACRKPLSAETRKRMSDARKLYKPTDAARRKMADAKRGSRNPKAVPVAVLSPMGELIEFASATAAAAWAGVSQQLFEQWMKGKSAWPGTGRFTKRHDLAWLTNWQLVTT